MRCSCGNFLGFATQEDVERELVCGLDYLSYLPCMPPLAGYSSDASKEVDKRGCGKVTKVTYADVRADDEEHERRNNVYRNAIHNLPGTPIPRHLMIPTAQ